MEKMTRVKKYKDLRENMKEEVSIERQEIVETVEDDDFLSFLPKKEEINIEDTLMNPLSYETLEETPDEVKEALNMAKLNVGKDQYNTRLDILNKIKNDDKKYNEDELKDVDFSNGYVVNEPQKKMSLLEKLAAMSPEEDVKELEKFEQQQKEEKQLSEEVKKEPEVKEIKKEKKEIIEEKEEKIELLTDLMQEEDEYEDDEEEEKGDKLLTVLNVIIMILIVVFIAFICFFAYQLFK